VSTRQKSGLPPPWKEGDPSPNPGGRPKKPITDAYLSKLLPAQAAGIAETMIRKARRGNIIAIKELTDRVEGKAPLGEVDRGPIMTSDEKRALLAELLDRLGLVPRQPAAPALLQGPPIAEQDAPERAEGEESPRLPKAPDQTPEPGKP
jgi:hypothetical protein